MSAFTPGPWYVRDFRASEMKRLGWNGPSIDRILITNQTGAEIEANAGADCVIARIQFDNRPEALSESNLADARLIAAAPELLDALAGLVDACHGRGYSDWLDTAKAALAKAMRP